MLGKKGKPSVRAYSWGNYDHREAGDKAPERKESGKRHVACTSGLSERLRILLVCPFVDDNADGQDTAGDRRRKMAQFSWQVVLGLDV